MQNNPSCIVILSFHFLTILSVSAMVSFCPNVSLSEAMVAASAAAAWVCVTWPELTIATHYNAARPGTIIDRQRRNVVNLTGRRDTARLVVSATSLPSYGVRRVYAVTCEFFLFQQLTIIYYFYIAPCPEKDVQFFLNNFKTLNVFTICGTHFPDATIY